MEKNEILVEISARHVHVSQQDLYTLFGEGYELTPKKDLSQPGQFACAEKVEVVGPKNKLACSILGPCRAETQVELSLTDARTIGLAVPIRLSADLAGSPGCKLVGPKGEVEISCGVIAAKRHAHLTPERAEELGVKDQQVVKIRVNSPDRSLIFDDVLCRVTASSAPAVHLDTDESNAAGMTGSCSGEVIL